MALAAIAGWGGAFLVWSRTADVAERLVTAEARLAETSDQLTASEGRLQQYEAAAGSLDEISGRLSRARDELAALETQLRSARKEQAVRTAQLDAAKAELDRRRANVDAAREELTGLELKVEGTRTELDRLKTERPRSPRSAQPLASRQSTGDAAVAPRVATKPPVKAPAKLSADKRFELVDENGDGKIDRTEFSFKKVQLLNAGDVNMDGIVTPDESLLTAEAFARFDQDGDGNISQLEFVDPRTFDLIDANSDGAISIEEVRRITQR
jgi:hypothetical protein